MKTVVLLIVTFSLALVLVVEIRSKPDPTKVVKTTPAADKLPRTSGGLGRIRNVEARIQSDVETAVGPAVDELPTAEEVLVAASTPRTIRDERAELRSRIEGSGLETDWAVSGRAVLSKTVNARLSTIGASSSVSPVSCFAKGCIVEITHFSTSDYEAFQRSIKEEGFDVELPGVITGGEQRDDGAIAQDIIVFDPVTVDR